MLNVINYVKLLFNNILHWFYFVINRQSALRMKYISSDSDDNDDLAMDNAGNLVFVKIFTGYLLI